MSQQEGTDVLEVLASLPTFHHPTVSPDGTSVATYYDLTGRNELHVIDIDTGEMAQWSDGEVPRNARWFVEWGPESDRVFYHLDDAGDEQNDIYAIDREGRVESVVEVDAQALMHDVSPDGRTLLFGNNDDGQMNVYRHELTTGETTKLTAYDRAVWASLLAPDGSRIAYSTNETDVYDNRDVYVAGADGSNPRNLDIGEVGAEAMPADWHPDGDRLLVADNSTDLMRPGIVGLETGEIDWFGPHGHEELPVQFLPEGDRFLALRARQGAVVPLVYDVATGAGRELEVPEGVSVFGGTNPGSTNAVIDGTRVLVSHTTANTRPELIVYDLEDDTYEVLLEAEYGDLDPSMFVDAQVRRIPSHDGLEIDTLFYDAGARPSPLVVNPHGGPRSANRREFDLRTQFLLSRGFSVLHVNYRGSTDRGRAFVESLIDDWGGAEQGDIAAAVEDVVETFEWIDPERIAVFGGSYGGYSVYMQMLQYPDLYAAGVAWVGVSDLVDMYENTMPHFRTELMEKYLGSPEANAELYESRSPTSLVENLRAPLLIGHGINDRRVPLSQARLMREELEAAGFEEGSDGDFEYVELGEEGHGSTDIEQKIRLLRLVDDFLSRRLG